MLTPIGEALQHEMDISGSFDGPEEVQSNTGSKVTDVALFKNQPVETSQ
jgi:hypothetical protein